MERRPRLSVGLVVVAVAFAAVPAAFTFYPELIELALGVRVLVGVVWFVALVVTAVFAVRRDRSLDQLLEGTRAEHSALLELTAARVFEAILDPDHVGIPPEYRVTVFLYDANVGRLRPAYPDAPDADDDVLGFAPGIGVTGQSYQEETFLVATGLHASDTTYSLTAAQQVRYAHLRSVAATPVRAAGQVVGVLAAAANIDDGAFARRTYREALRSLADAVGILVDCLGLTER